MEPVGFDHHHRRCRGTGREHDHLRWSRDLRLRHSGALPCDSVRPVRIVDRPGRRCDQDRTDRRRTGWVEFQCCGVRLVLQGADRHLVEAGANVAVVSRSEANSSKVATALEAIRPGSAKPYAVDVADFDAEEFFVYAFC